MYIYAYIAHECVYAYHHRHQRRHGLQIRNVIYSTIIINIISIFIAVVDIIKSSHLNHSGMIIVSIDLYCASLE